MRRNNNTLLIEAMRRHGIGFSINYPSYPRTETKESGTNRKRCLPKASTIYMVTATQFTSSVYFCRSKCKYKCKYFRHGPDRHRFPFHYKLYRITVLAYGFLLSVGEIKLTISCRQLWISILLTRRVENMICCGTIVSASLETIGSKQRNFPFFLPGSFRHESRQRCCRHIPRIFIVQGNEKVSRINKTQHG